MRAQSLGGYPPFCVCVFVCLAVPTAALGADAPVAEAFAAGFLPPVIHSLGYGPFGTVLVRGKVRPGRDPQCPGKAIVRTGGRHVPEHTV